MNSISPIDGRYINKTCELQSYFSEKTLFQYRINIEILYFQSLLKTIFDLNITTIFPLCELTTEDYNNLKELEKNINHDVKAVEYFLKKKLELYPNLLQYKEFIHFGLTSEDINSTAYICMIKNSIKDIINPTINNIINVLINISNDFKHIMSSYTHGQPASVTTLDKELYVFIYRLQKIAKANVHNCKRCRGSTSRRRIVRGCWWSSCSGPWPPPQMPPPRGGGWRGGQP